MAALDSDDDTSPPAADHDGAKSFTEIFAKNAAKLS
jgi:hypothetical protein